MSAVPANSMGFLCVVGGAIGFLKGKSVPSLVAGLLFGATYLYSAYVILARCSCPVSALFTPCACARACVCLCVYACVVSLATCVLLVDSSHLISGEAAPATGLQLASGKAGACWICRWTLTRPILTLYTAAASIALAGVMGKRFYSTGKFMPPGLLTVAGLASALYYVNQTLAASK